MHHGICPLSIAPMRSSADHSAEMISQLLYGEHFKIIEQRKHWSKIRMAFDDCEGWVSNGQIRHISENEYKEIEIIENKKSVSDLVSYVQTDDHVLLPIMLGSSIDTISILKHTFDGDSSEDFKDKPHFLNTAILYINAPHLWGGRTPFGIDAAGFTQMVYKINGYRLLRKPCEQATQGTPLSFIEESEAGDLAFFDNSEGVIDHVGLIMENNYVIHVHEKVRIDRLDHTGIFNTEIGNYTHSLRVIKKIA